MDEQELRDRLFAVDRLLRASIDVGGLKHTQEARETIREAVKQMLLTIAKELDER